MPSPSRKALKAAMLAVFMEKDPIKKKQFSKKFTKLLFGYVEGHMDSRSEDEISQMQMEAIGLFGTYVFSKNKEKREQKEKSAQQTLKEIADESDELYDEIELRINHST